eukprot:8197512-Pyramimonas_sp.AAC.1
MGIGGSKKKKQEEPPPPAKSTPTPPVAAEAKDPVSEQKGKSSHRHPEIEEEELDGPGETDLPKKRGIQPIESGKQSFKPINHDDSTSDSKPPPKRRTKGMVPLQS